MPSLLSDAGGIAARIGFKYQDHVAATLVLEMIRDRRLTHVECETDDDITLTWNSPDGPLTEYVQVKTTDKDTKWTLTEILAKSDKNRPTSLVEKSLLADTRPTEARFRIVARRGLNKALMALGDPVDSRADPETISALAQKIKKKIKKTISANGRDGAYWVQNMFWQVLPDAEFLQNSNLQSINRMAEECGANPTSSHALNIYKDLLDKVEKAASTSRRTPTDKVLSRQDLLAWWQKHLEDTAAAQRKTSKPYRIRGDAFLAEISTFTEDSVRRYGAGYDAQYEQGAWRALQLARYLVTWLPEVTLRASELVEVDQLNLRQKLEAALKVVKAQRQLDLSDLIGELTLHCILRHVFGTEPIACKLFYQSHLGGKVVGSAHIKPGDAGDELWLGRAKMLDVNDPDALTKAITAVLVDALSPEVLSEERDIILQLREPQHLTTNSLEQALSRGAPVDALVKVLCLPLLFLYNSQVLSGGYSVGYQSALVAEIERLYNTAKQALPAHISEVKVFIFLVPVESLSALRKHFSDQLDNP